MPGLFHVCLLEGVIEDQNVSKLIRSRQGNQSVKWPLMSHIVPSLDQFGREPCVSPTSPCYLGILGPKSASEAVSMRQPDRRDVGDWPWPWILGLGRQ